MKPKAISLKLWSGLVFGFLLYQCFLYFYGDAYDLAITEDRNHKQFEASFQDLERNFQRADSSIFKVVVIGSSLVAQGIECPDKIKSISIKKHQQKIQIQKIFLPHDELKFLTQEKHIFKKLLNLKPDLILIHNNWLTTDILKYQLYANKSSFLQRNFLRPFTHQMNKNKRFYRTLPYFFSKIEHDNELEPCSYFFQPEKGLDTLSFRPLERYNKREADIAYINPDLLALKKANIKTIILDIPRPKEAEKAIHSGELEKGFQAHLKRYKTQFGMDYWQYDGKEMYFKYFYDFGHLNEEGKQIYSEWLVDKIVKEMLQ